MQTINTFWFRSKNMKKTFFLISAILSIVNVSAHTDNHINANHIEAITDFTIKTTTVHGIKKSGDTTMNSDDSLPTSKSVGDFVSLKIAGINGGSSMPIMDTLVAYVSTTGNDGTANIGNASKPFLTIDAALIATTPQAVVIKIGIGEFNSPSVTNIRSNVSFLGSGQPDVNNITSTPSHDGATVSSSPTKLIGGTILHNSLLIPWNANYVIIKNLGIDVGSDWCASFNSGTATDALLIAQQYTSVIASGGSLSADGIHRLQDTLRIGINVENVTCLCKDAKSLVHAALFENCYKNHVTNLKTYFGFAGCVIKTISGIYSNISANGHAVYGIVFKDNDYSKCRSNSLTNFTIRSINSFDGMGLSFSSGVDIGSGSVVFCNVSNGAIEGTTWGIHTDGNPVQGTTSGCNINGITIFQTQHEGVLANWTYTKLANSLAWLTGNTGFDITNTIGANNTVSNCQALAATGDGFHLTSTPSYTSISFDNLVATDNTGYGVVVSGNVNGIGIICKNNGTNAISGTLANIGINTSIPSALLDINGDGVNDPFKIENILSANNTGLYKPACIAAAGNVRVLNSWPINNGIYPYIEKSSSYTILSSDYTINCISGTFTVTLLSAVGLTGKDFTIANSGSGIITIATTPSQTFTNVVSNPSTITMSTVGSHTFRSNGATGYK